jgi:hypothetical protein
MSNTNARPDGRAKRFFAYYGVDNPALIGKRRALCRALVVEQGGSIVDDACDVGPGVVVDMAGYAHLYDVLDRGTVDAFVTDMTVFGPTMILGLFAMCAVNGIEMWDLSRGRVTAEQIHAVGESLRHGLDAQETVQDMLSPKSSLTAYIPVDDIENDDLVVARGLSAVEAMKIAFGYEDGWSTHLGEEDYGSFTLYTFWAHPKKKTGRPDNLQATIVRTDEPELDRMTGLNTIAAQFLRRQGRVWDGRVVSDEDFDKRVRRVAEAREVRRIDREIATKLVDAFLADGYTITCDLQDREPEFERSTDRNGILEYLWQVEIAELWVHKGRKRGWLRLIFDEEGWDLVQDYSVDLEHIVDPICEPYLPWNHADADRRDHGIRVLALNSPPDDVLKIEGMLK